MKYTRLITSLIGAALACTSLTSLLVSADFHCPEKLQGDVVSTPNSQDGQIYTDDGPYIASTVHTALVVVVKPGAAFPNEILSAEQHKIVDEEHLITIVPSPWTRWFPPIDDCLPIDETAPQYEAGVFEQTFSAKKLSADSEDLCGPVYRGALTKYALSDCWLLSSTVMAKHKNYFQHNRWKELVKDLKESPAVQGIYEVGYNFVEPAVLTGGFEFKTTSDKVLTLTDFTNVTVPGYPDFAVKSIKPVPIPGMREDYDYNDGWFHIDITGIELSDYAGYHKAWQAMKLIVDEKAAVSGVKVFEISMNAAVQNAPVGPESGMVGIPFADALYEAEIPKTYGDVNADGKFDDSDAAVLHEWLMGVPEAKLADAEAADLNGDGTLNACDLCRMKRELLALKNVQSITLSTKQYQIPYSASEDVTFHAAVTLKNEQQRGNLFVELYNASGNQLIGVMHDDGAEENGDSAANDLTWSCITNVKCTSAKPMYFYAVVGFCSGNNERVEICRSGEYPIATIALPRPNNF